MRRLWHTGTLVGTYLVFNDIVLRPPETDQEDKDNGKDTHVGPRHDGHVVKQSTRLFRGRLVDTILLDVVVDRSDGRLRFFNAFHHVSIRASCSLCAFKASDPEQRERIRKSVSYIVRKQVTRTKITTDDRRCAVLPSEGKSPIIIDSKKEVSPFQYTIVSAPTRASN